MIPLPQKIRKNGYDYTQVLRGGKSCIYAQWSGEIIMAYEVMKIRVKPGRWIKGTWIEEREKFPADEDFGYTAWSYPTWERAKEKYDELEYK